MAGEEERSIAGLVPVIEVIFAPTTPAGAPADVTVVTIALASDFILKASTVILAVGIAPTEASKLYSLINPLPIETIEELGVKFPPTTSSPSLHPLVSPRYS